jgi:hypothetical protein
MSASNPFFSVSIEGVADPIKNGGAFFAYHAMPFDMPLQ